MTKLETLLAELAKTTLNCLENQSDIFLTFRFSPNSKVLDFNFNLPNVSSKEDEEKLSKNIAVLLYLILYSQCNEILTTYVDDNNNPIIKESLNHLNKMIEATIPEEESNGIKLLEDGSVDPMAAIELEKL